MKFLAFFSVMLLYYASSFAQTDSARLYLNKDFEEAENTKSGNDSSDCSIPGLVFVDEQANEP